MEEIWKDIKGYEGLYQISNLERVKSLEKLSWNGHVWWTKKELILNPVNSMGYKSVRLCKSNKCKSHRIHILVATYFIPNPENKRMVNHINHDRWDSRVENLEWVSDRENCTHARLRMANKNGYQNVKKYHNRNYYGFYTMINGKYIYKGYYKTAKEAHEGYLQFLADNNIVNKYATAV
jgi:hypothetical protein